MATKKKKRKAKKTVRPRRSVPKKRARSKRKPAARRSNPVTRKAKTNRWYKGPRGVKIRVRRSKGKFVVDIKK